MSWLLSLIGNLFAGRRRDAELDEDVRSYVDLLADEKIAQGMPADHARRAALLEVGGLEGIKEETREARAARF